MLSSSRHTTKQSPQYALEQLFQLNGDLNPVGAPEEGCSSADLGPQSQRVLTQFCREAWDLSLILGSRMMGFSPAGYEHREGFVSLSKRAVGGGQQAAQHQG